MYFTKAYSFSHKLHVTSFERLQQRIESNKLRGAWLAQSVEHAALGLGVVSSSPILGIGLTYLRTWFKETCYNDFYTLSS